LTCTLYQRQLNQLLQQARVPGWKAYAWNRAKELDADQSGMFAGIADALVKAIGQDVGKESVGHSLTKPR
jgi:hypothetical protein